MEEATAVTLEEQLNILIAEIKQLNKNIEAMNAKKAQSRDFKPRSFGGGDRNFPRGDKKPWGDKKPFSDRKPWGDKKPFGDRKPFGRPAYDKDDKRVIADGRDKTYRRKKTF